MVSNSQIDYLRSTPFLVASILQFIYCITVLETGTILPGWMYQGQVYVRSTLAVITLSLRLIISSFALFLAAFILA